MDDREESPKTVRPSGLTRPGFSTRYTSTCSNPLSTSLPKATHKALSSEASDTDNAKATRLRSRSYSKERSKIPGSGKVSRVSSTERSRARVRRQASKNIASDSDSSEGELPSSQATRHPRSSLPVSQSSARKSSLPRPGTSRRTLGSRAGSSQYDDAQNKDTGGPRQPTHKTKVSLPDKTSNTEPKTEPGTQNSASRTHTEPSTQKALHYASSDPMDSGINSSKDSDMASRPVASEQPNATVPCGNAVDSFSVVKLTDSMLSVYEIQEGDSEKKRQEIATATSEMCSNDKSEVGIVVTPDSGSDVSSEKPVDDRRGWGGSVRARTYSGGSMLLPSERSEESEDMHKSLQRHSWGEEREIPLALNTWHGPDTASLPTKHLVSALDSSGISNASSESECEKHSNVGPRGSQLKSYLSTQLSQAKSQSPTRRQITVQTQETKSDSKPPVTFTSRIRPTPIEGD